MAAGTALSPESARRTLEPALMNSTIVLGVRAALHLAVRSGNIEIASLFFRPEVLPHLDLNFRDREGNTALHLATQLEIKFASRVLELLLCFGADANAANLLKQTPLHLCAMIKRNGVATCELMETLLRHTADPQKVDFLKRSPLHYCMEKG